ncbi:HIR complex subunit [Savitreella phatthalungensis]
MKVVRPGWLGHHDQNYQKQPIYSVDVSPDGSRLATGGLDGKVRVWATEMCTGAVPAEDGNDGLQIQTGIRATIPAHSGGVLCIKFSPDGRWLATGSDDKFLIIWERDDSAAATRRTFGDSDADGVMTEAWKVHKRLLGHENDIVDVAWAHDTSLLVTVSLDSHVIVWNASSGSFEKIRSLQHGSSVKGVVFDPAGKYFATASDDRTIRVWRTSDLGCEHVIDKPFKNSPISTYFRRLSWSPDGAHIGGPNAVNSPVRVISIINRGTWTHDISLVGHEGAIEVVRFNPIIFRKDGNNCTILAGAGADRTVSVWNTLSSKPVITLNGMAEQSIADLAWSPDGLALYIAGLDGSLTVCCFSAAEFGEAQGREANEEALSKYGAGRQGAILPESVEQLRLEDAGRVEKAQAVQSRVDAIMGGTDEASQQQNEKSSENEQIQAKASASSITASNGTAQSPAAAPMANETQTTSSASKIALATANATPANPVAPADPPVAAPAQAAAQPYVQKMTIVNGKKRVQPQLISSGGSSAGAGGAAGSGAGGSALQRGLAGAVISGQRQETVLSLPQLDISAPSYALPKGGMPTALQGAKRAATTTDNLDGHTDKRQANGLGGVSAIGSSEKPVWIRPAVVSPATEMAQVRLGVPQVKSLITFGRDGNAREVLEARNPEEAGPSQQTSGQLSQQQQHQQQIHQQQQPCKVSLLRGDKVDWHDYVASPVVLLAGTDSFYAAGCEDGGIIVWTHTGRRAVCELVTEAVACFLEARGDCLMAITSVGLVHVWDLRRRRATMPPVSVAPILDAASLSDDKLSRGPAITQASVTSAGSPILTLNNGDGYVYNTDMHVWQRVSQVWWSVTSHYWNGANSLLPPSLDDVHDPSLPAQSNPDPQPALPRRPGLLSLVERRTNEETSRHGKGRLLQRVVKQASRREGFESLESRASLAHLEHRLCAAVLLDSPAEYVGALLTFARRIAEDADLNKVAELCTELFGPRTHLSKSSVWEPEVLGISKHKLLRKCLVVMGKFRGVQRLTTQYMDLLDMEEDGGGDGRDRTQDAMSLA